MATTTQIYKWVTLRHGRTRFIEVGSGQPLVLLHQSSIEGGADDYLRCLAALSANHRVIVPDLLSWPPSDTQADINAFPFLVDFLRELQDALDIEKWDICGVSMGGWIAGLFAYESPERCRRVVMSGHPFTGGPNRNMLEYDESSVTSDEKVGEWLDKVCAGEDVDTEALLRQKLEKIHEPGFVEAFAKLMRSMGAPANRAHFAMIHRLPRLRVPTLVLLGERDKAAMAAKEQVEEALSPGSQLSVIASGHRMHVEDPDVFTAAVLQYLDGA